MEKEKALNEPQNDVAANLNEPQDGPAAAEEGQHELPADAAEEQQDPSAEPPSEPSKRFCGNCGFELTADQPFCPHCGQQVGAPDPSPAANFLAMEAAVRKNRNKTIAVIVGVVAAIAAILAVAMVIIGPQPKSVTLNKSSVTVRADESTTLTYTIDPDNTKNKTVTWASSNTSVATVKDGTVSGVNEGNCTITVTTKNGKTATCDVTVLPPAPNLQALYNQYCSSLFAQLAADGSYLFIDTNPYDIDNYSSSDAITAIRQVTAALNLPDSVLNRMGQTRALDGTQTYSTDDLDVSWTYHPDNGLQVLYALK